MMQYSAYNETVTTVTPAEVKVEAKLFEQEERLPTIYDAQVLEQAGEVNGVSGLEKELLVTDVDSSEEPFSIDKDGNGTVKVNDDVASRYSKTDGGQLVYER